MKITELNNFLNELLMPQEFKDYCPNGMIVEGRAEITSGITGVSLNKELIEKAILKKASFIFVHHPHDFWQNQPNLITGRLKQKIKLLIDYEISVFAFHLPLDAHPIYGNNASLCKALGLKVVDHFAYEGKHPIGFIGEYPEAISRTKFLELVADQIGPPNFVLPFGSDNIKRVALCSGSYPQGAEEVLSRGDIDLYLTGEIREQTTYIMQEEHFNFVAAGHHQTERFGPRAIGEAISAKFGINVEFVDTFNPV